MARSNTDRTHCEACGARLKANVAHYCDANRHLYQAPPSGSKKKRPIPRNAVRGSVALTPDAGALIAEGQSATRLHLIDQDAVLQVQKERQKKGGQNRGKKTVERDDLIRKAEAARDERQAIADNQLIFTYDHKTDTTEAQRKRLHIVNRVLRKPRKSRS